MTDQQELAPVVFVDFTRQNTPAVRKWCQNATCGQWAVRGSKFCRDHGGGR